MTLTTTTETDVIDAFMTVLQKQGHLHSAKCDHDGSWQIRRTADGPLFRLDDSTEAMDYLFDVLLDIRLGAAA